MLKINKTLPKNKVRQGDWCDDSYTKRVGYLGLATLICGIMPGLMGLNNYIVPAQSASAAGYDITQISTMQEMQPYICDNTEIGQSATLTDTRDDSTYTVTKLADSKCWMTQNLRIVDKIITPEDSDVEEDFTIPASALWNDQTIDTLHAYYNNNEDYGAYYNWYTATAGTGTETMTGGNASGSICPKGWRLPKSGTGVVANEFANMVGIPTGTDILANINYWNNISNKAFADGILSVNGNIWLAAGYVQGGTLNSVGSGGRYWSSTVYDADRAYYLMFGNGGITPAGSSEKYNNGYSLRCLAEGWPSQEVNIVAVRVAPVISIDAVSGMTEEVEPHKVTEGTISATVSANTTYDVLLSTNNTSLTNPEDKDGSLPSIPAVSSTNPVQPNTNAWGILNNPILTNNTHTYSPITTTPTSFYNTANYDETTQSTTHTFTIGVSVAPSLPAGEYSTTVTITAVNN